MALSGPLSSALARRLNDSLSLGAGAGVIYDVAAAALFARMTAQPNAIWKNAYNNAFLTAGFKAIVAKLDGLYVKAGPDIQSGLLNLCANNSATVVGTVPHTPGVGVFGNGNNNYISTGLTLTGLANAQQNSNTMFAYLTNGGSGANQALIGIPENFQWNIFLDANSFSSRHNDTVNLSSGLTAGGPAFIASVRSGATARRMRLNKVQVGSDAQASAARAGTDVRLFQVWTQFCQSPLTTSVGFWGFGAALTDVELDLLADVFDKFILDIQNTQFLVVGAGQSNISLMSDPVLSGTGVAGSDAFAMSFAPTLKPYLDAAFTSKPNTLTADASTAYGGSSINPIVGIDKNWWLPGTGDGNALTNWKTLVSAMGGFSTKGKMWRNKKIAIVWAQGEAEAAYDDATAPLAAWYSSTMLVFAAMRAHFASMGYTGIVPIIIQPLGPNITVDQTRLALVRSTQTNFATDVANCYMAPSTMSITRIDPGNWHAVPITTSFNGYYQMAQDLANAVGPRIVV